MSKRIILSVLLIALLFVSGCATDFRKGEGAIFRCGVQFSFLESAGTANTAAGESSSNALSRARGSDDKSGTPFDSK